MCESGHSNYDEVIKTQKNKQHIPSLTLTAQIFL